MQYRATNLEGRRVRLEPLAPDHKEGLCRAAADPRIWPFMFMDAADQFEIWWQHAEAARDRNTDAHFVVRRLADDSIVGSTRYLNLAPEHKRLEIGNTWYAPAVWGSEVNPECKLLLMTHAFETLGCNRVEFRCDSRNERSRAALHKLGAVEEGVLRKHMIVQHGHVRDTVQFGVTSEDWPRVKAGLQARLTG